MDKINILHIYQNSKVGGVQQQLLNLLNFYDKEVFNPAVCCLGKKEEIGKAIETLGVDFTAFNIKRHYKFSIGIIIQLYKLIKKKQIHVVRTHKYRASLYGRIAAWFAGVPVIISSVHGNYHKDRRLERKIANKILSIITDRIVAVSESIKKDIINYDGIDPSKIMVIQNGVDTSRFNPELMFHSIRKEFLIAKDEILLGFVGRLVPAKGLEYLIEAVSLLDRKFEKVKLLVIGDGALLEPLKAKAGEYGVSDRIIFTGERRDIIDILSSIDIFVMPSLAEGLPNSLLEALSMGKPIVATAVGGIPAAIRDGVSGLLVQPRDPQGLSAAIEKIITDKQMAEQMAEQARDFVEKNFSMKSTAQKWESLYKSLLREKGFANSF